MKQKSQKLVSLCAMKSSMDEKERFFPQEEHETYFQHLPHLFDVYNIPLPRRVSHHTLSINKAIKKMDVRSEEKSILLCLLLKWIAAW